MTWLVFVGEFVGCEADGVGDALTDGVVITIVISTTGEMEGRDEGMGAGVGVFTETGTVETATRGDDGLTAVGG